MFVITSYIVGCWLIIKRPFNDTDTQWWYRTALYLGLLTFVFFIILRYRLISYVITKLGLQNQTRSALGYAPRKRLINPQAYAYGPYELPPTRPSTLPFRQRATLTPVRPFTLAPEYNQYIVG